MVVPDSRSPKGVRGLYLAAFVTNGEYAEKPDEWNS